MTARDPLYAGGGENSDVGDRLSGGLGEEEEVVEEGPAEIFF